jgi:mRNA-degrading endonuclease RelE of RelBE toxin-antitoxin system
MLKTKDKVQFKYTGKVYKDLSHLSKEDREKIEKDLERVQDITKDGQSVMNHLLNENPEQIIEVSFKKEPDKIIKMKVKDLPCFTPRD